MNTQILKLPNEDNPDLITDRTGDLAPRPSAPQDNLGNVRQAPSLLDSRTGKTGKASVHDTGGKTMLRTDDTTPSDMYDRLAALLEHSMQQLQNKMSSQQTPSAVVPIQTFEPEPFDLIQEIKVVIQQADEDEFLATFFDANIGAGGGNQVEAMENLKETLLSRFDYLERLPPDTLGPGPSKQLAILRTFIRRKD